MPKQNFKSHAKRKRELAKLDKRVSKDQKRAARRTGPGETDGTVVASEARSATGAQSASAPTPRTLAEAVERWKTMKVGTKHR